MGVRDPPGTGGPVGIPTVAGLVVRVYVSFAERGMEELFPLHLPAGGDALNRSLRCII